MPGCDSNRRDHVGGAQPTHAGADRFRAGSRLVGTARTRSNLCAPAQSRETKRTVNARTLPIDDSLPPAARGAKAAPLRELPTQRAGCESVQVRLITLSDDDDWSMADDPSRTRQARHHSAERATASATSRSSGSTGTGLSCQAAPRRAWSKSTSTTSAQARPAVPRRSNGRHAKRRRVKRSASAHRAKRPLSRPTGDVAATVTAAADSNGSTG